jgi:hypothetical protein
MAFLSREEYRRLAAGEKSRLKPLREGDRGLSRPLDPDPSIRGCVGGARKRTDGDHHDCRHLRKDPASPIASRLAPALSAPKTARPGSDGV